MKIFRQIILLNELGGNADLIYRFSPSAGGKSGIAFGLTQLDISNNPAAVRCLQECGLNSTAIENLKAQSFDPSILDCKLIPAIVDKYDNGQLTECLNRVRNLTGGMRLESGVLYHLADYHNQFYMSRNGKMHRFLQGLHREVIKEDVLYFKLKETKWGRENPRDVYRRFDNIEKVLSNVK